MASGALSLQCYSYTWAFIDRLIDLYIYSNHKSFLDFMTQSFQ